MKFKMAANDTKFWVMCSGQGSKCHLSHMGVIIFRTYTTFIHPFPPPLWSFFKIASSTPDGGDDYNSNNDRK